jgi:DNA-binding response OmpR family regulator
MSGETMLAEMRMDDSLSRIPVVVVSSDASEGRRRRLRYLGAEFVSKPFKPEELVAAVDRLLQAATQSGAHP